MAVIENQSAGTPARARRMKHDGHALAGGSVLRRLRPRTALVEQVVERIREGVFRGEFPTGSELPSQGKLASSLGVSYTVMREAMQVLRSHGLVEVCQGRCPRIKHPESDAVYHTLNAMLRASNSKISQLTELRRPLECEIAVLAAQRATTVEIEQMEKAIVGQTAAKTLDQQIKYDMEFHNLLAVAAGNKLFSLVLSAVWELLWESRRRTISKVGSDHALAGHRALLDAIRCHDPQRAREVMAKHFDNIIQDL